MSAAPTDLELHDCRACGEPIPQGHEHTGPDGEDYHFWCCPDCGEAIE